MRDALVTSLLAIIAFLCVMLTAMALRYERRPDPVRTETTLETAR